MPVPVGYFVSVTPGGSFAGGGLFAPHFKDATRMVRDRIAADPQAFLDIVEAPGFAERFRFVGMPLKNVPKGDEACRRALLDSFAAMKTFNEYLTEALEGFAMPTR